MTRARLVRDLLIALAVVGGAVGLTTRYVAVPWAVAGDSMEPTLRAGDRVLVDLWTYRRRGPRVGEIAVFAGPDGRPMVKRVVGGPRAGLGPGRPAEERYDVAGDNPGASVDSRDFGPVPGHRFRGRVVWCYWPPSRSGPIR